MILMKMKNDIPKRKDGGIKWNFRPVNQEELEACLKDPLWRVCSGALYKIIIKGDDKKEKKGGLFDHLPREVLKELAERMKRMIGEKAIDGEVVKKG